VYTNSLFIYAGIPLISALIGWFTNYVAIKMLFRPRREQRFMGLRFIGLIPGRQKELAENIAETIESNLISHRDIQEILQSPATEEEISRLIGEQVDSFIQQRLGKIPLLKLLFRGNMSEQIKELVIQQFRTNSPVFVDKLLEKMEQRVDFRKIIREKVEAFDVSKLEDMIYRISSKELKAIELLGGVLGFLIGLVQVAMIAFSPI
jgi:uncharacterized membrane protein YheB (UPF0754 family)